MSERCSTSPVLMTAIDVEDLRCARPAQIVTQPGTLMRDRLTRRHAGEWKDVGWIKERRIRLRVARRLGKSMVEAAASGTRGVHEESVERDTTALVGIESLVEIMADEPAGL